MEEEQRKKIKMNQIELYSGDCPVCDDTVSSDGPTKGEHLTCEGCGEKLEVD